MGFVKFTPTDRKNATGKPIYSAEFVRSLNLNLPQLKGPDMLKPQEGARNQRPRGTDTNAPIVPEDA